MTEYADSLEELATRNDVDETHEWRNSTYNDCCSCGWRCAGNSTGAHNEAACKRAHARHVSRETEPPDAEE